MSAESLLRDAEELVLRGDRARQHGHPPASMRRVALAWSGILGITVTGREVALCLAAMKLCRDGHRHGADNLLDAAGYVLIAAMSEEAQA